MKRNIIQICGLCGSGKTTLIKRLSKELNAKVFQIDEYRKKHDKEEHVWYKFADDIANCNYKNILIETTGVNAREIYLHHLEIERFFLDASLKTLNQRINKKPLLQRGFFSYIIGKRIFREFKDKKDFNKKMSKYFNKNKLFGTIINAESSKEDIYQQVKELINE